MTAANRLLKAAIRYAELGYRVFPCAPRSKIPITEHGFRDATDDVRRIEEWWTQHPEANIGLPTEGLLVIDIDGRENQWLVGDGQRAADLAAAPTSITPRGGSHRIFRQPAGRNWRCTESRLAPKVDTRADGGYIVVPPSELSGGRAYRWAPGLELDVGPDQLPEPPAWLTEELDRLATERPSRRPGQDGNTIPKGVRNDTLISLGGTMRRVGMTRAEIAAALHQVNRDRCVPPLSPAEVERVIESAIKYKPDSIAVALAEHHWNQMYSRTQAGQEPEISDPGPVPDELLCVPGFVNDVMAYTLQTAPYPERVIAFCGALALQAVLAGRKVMDRMGNRTNLYILGLAGSGVGKDHARQVNQRILYQAGMAECLGNSFASGEGIEDRLFLEPVVLYQVDEIDGLLMRVGQAKDARHEQIVSILLQMYSSASSVYVMRAKAGQERAVINQPSLSLFGTAVPKHFYESLSPRLLTNGFLARMIILESHRRGAGQEDNDRPVPPGIIETACWWAGFRPGKSGNLDEWNPEPKVIEQTEEAREHFRRIRERSNAAYAAAEAGNDPVAMAIWARAYEKARRLALIYSCSAEPRNPIIDAAAAAWAGEFVEYQTRRMLFMSKAYASEGEFDSRRKRLLELLSHWRSQHGDQWMPFWRISRKLPWTRKDHEEVRVALLEQELIEVTTTHTGGRPGIAYRLLPTPRPGGDTS